MVKVWVAAVDVLMLVMLSSPRGGVTSGGGARRRAEGDVAIGFEEALPLSVFTKGDLELEELNELMAAGGTDGSQAWYEQVHADRTTPEQKAKWDTRLKEIKQKQHRRNQNRQRRRAQRQEEEEGARQRAYDLGSLDFRQESQAGAIPRGWSYTDVGPTNASNVLDAQLSSARADAASGSTCDDDPLASSEPGSPCAYSCESLALYYYPDAPEVICYLYDGSTDSWPGKTCSTRGVTSCTAMDASEELLQRRQHWLDWHIFAMGDDTQLLLQFQVGAGATCVNVTVQTDQTLGPVVRPGSPTTHLETRCLLEGYHELDHDAVGSGTTRVIGQAEDGENRVYHSVSHDGFGTSEFRIGECEDIWLRVQTDEGSTGSLSFELDDGRHNGPWSIDVADGANLEVGVTYEESMCLFDNVFNLTRTDSGGWHGQVTILSKMPDNTITIPTGAPEDQSYPSNFAWYPEPDARPKWIIHGREDVDGIPVKLDARLRSGGDLISEEGCGDFEVSYASIVLRKVRFSNQKAVLDRFAEFRTHSTAGDANSHGGALDYTGGWGATIIFDECVFDHLYASEGANAMFDGQIDEWARRHHAEAQAGNLPGTSTLREADTLLIEEKYTLTVLETNNLYWECHARVGGAIRWAESHPKNVTIIGNQYVDNIAVVGSGPSDSVRSNCFDDDTGILGRQYITISGVEMTDGPDQIPGFSLSPFRFGPLNGHWEVPDQAATAHIISIDDVVIYDQHLTCMPGFTIYNTGNCKGGCMHTSYSNIDLSQLTGTWKVYTWTAQNVFHWADNFTMTTSRIVNGGVVDDSETAVADGGGIHADVSGFGSLSHTFIGGMKAAVGGAATFAGSGYVEIIDCVFQGNIAWQQGGGLALKAASGNLIRDCIFFRNYVGVEIPVHVDIVVRVFTGATGYGLQDEDDADGEETIPVWKIDGPRPNDQEIGGMGECLPNETVYGLGSNPGGPNSGLVYEPFRTYATTVSVSSGVHTLWTGLVINTATVVSGWRGGGWIDIVEVRDKIYPTIEDDRSARYLTPGGTTGCVHDKNAPESNRCGKGVAVWHNHTFEVPYGSGGGVASMDAPTVTILGTNFTGNSAGRGSAVSVTSASELTIVGTTYDNVDRHTSYFDGAEIAGCTDTPCAVGNRCTLGQLSLFCEPCRANEIGLDGIDCEPCPPGTQPNDDQTACTACTAGKSSASGLCTDCELGKVSTDDFTGCLVCPSGTVAGLGTTCEACDAGKYSTSDGNPFCQECPPGETSNEVRSGCSRCTDGTVRSSGQSECTSCPIGKEPAADSAGCEMCIGAGTYSPRGLICELCTPGTEPFDNRTGCQPCSAGTAGINGECAQCELGRYSRAGQPICATCSEGMEPNDGKTACQCKLGTYDSESLGFVKCEGVAKVTEEQRGQCTLCPPCLDCTVEGITRLKEGFTAYGTSNDVFSCPYPPACPVRELNDTSGNRVSDQICAQGYNPEAPLCAMCAPDYNAYKVGQVCSPCDDVTINVPLLIGFLAAALAATASVVSGAYAWAVDNGMMTDFRIILGLYLLRETFALICGSVNEMMSSTCNVQNSILVLGFSLFFVQTELMGIAKLLFLDIKALIHMDCFDLGGFYVQLVNNIFILPLLATFGCYVYYLTELKTVERMVAEGATDDTGRQSAKRNLQRNLMVGVFLMYPMICTMLFRIPMCRELAGASFHESDYYVSCNTSTFNVLLFFGFLGVLLVPVGVPLLFFLEMRTRVQRLGGANETEAGGAKLVDDDADDQSDEFAFLCQDYRPSAWYWEPVNYLRKLLLNGLTVVVGRGTMGQIYFATLTSSLFLVWHVRVWPFVIQKHNMMEALGEATLLLMYTTCLLLRNDNDDDWTREWMSRTGYGWMIVVLYVIICPAPMFYSLWLRLRPNGDKSDGLRESKFENPLGDGPEDSDIVQVGSQSAEQRVAMANRRKRKSKSLATELAQAKTAAAKAEAELAALKGKTEPNGVSSGMTYSLDTRRASQVSALRGLADDGMVEQETLQKAQQSFSNHVRDQIDYSDPWNPALSKSRDSLRAFLNRPDVRLGHHAQSFMKIGGQSMVADDVPLMTEEEVAQLSSAMTRIEASRLSTVVQQIQLPQPAKQDA